MHSQNIGWHIYMDVNIKAICILHDHSNYVFEKEFILNLCCSLVVWPGVFLSPTAVLG